MPRPDPVPSRRRKRTPLDRALRDVIRAVTARRGRGAPPAAGLPQPAVPPRGPLPLAGGAEAPLDLSD